MAKMDDLLENALDEFEEFFDVDRLEKTLSKMIKIRETFSCSSEVDNTIHDALIFHQFIIALEKEMKLKRNEFQREYDEYNSTQEVAIMKQVNKGYANEFKNQTDRNKIVKLMVVKKTSNYVKTLADIDAILKFLENQMWFIKTYLNVLENRKSHFLAIERINRNN